MMVGIGEQWSGMMVGQLWLWVLTVVVEQLLDVVLDALVGRFAKRELCRTARGDQAFPPCSRDTMTLGGAENVFMGPSLTINHL